MDWRPELCVRLGPREAGSCCHPTFTRRVSAFQPVRISGFQDSRIQDSGRAVANQRRSFYIKTTQTHFHTPRSSFHRCFSSKGPCSGFPEDLIFHLFLGNQKCTISRKVQKEPDRRVDYIFLPLSLLDTVGHRRRPRLLIHFFSSKVTPGVWTLKRLGIGFDQIVVAGEKIL